jgi:hypothetical protein
MNMQIPTFAARKPDPIAVVLVLIAPLFGCGGSGDSSASNTDPPPALPTSNPATGGGMWRGELSRGGEVVNDATCLLLEAGELACVLMDTSDIYVAPFDINNRIVGAMHGAVQVSRATQASGSGKIYATPGNVLTDGSSVVADFTVTGGSLNDSDRWNNYLLELTFTSLGVETTFNGHFNDIYADYTPGGFLISLRTDGVYTDFNIYGDPASLSIDPDGGLFIQSASGCSGNGKMTRVGPPFAPNVKAHNAYNVELTVSDCPGLDGAYEGLATFIDFAWLDGDGTDNLVIAVFNDTTALVAEAVRRY